MDTTSEPTVHCSFCGADETLHWYETMNAELLKHQLCFECNFWREKVEWARANNPRAARVGGSHYMVEPMVTDDTPRHWLGYGGSQYTVKFHDGRTVKTNNLWHQGMIPERWRPQLPDNAEFVKEQR